MAQQNIKQLMPEELALRTAKIADIETSLPSWTQVKAAIDSAFTNTKQNAVITKMARVVYWLAKGTEV